MARHSRLLPQVVCSMAVIFGLLTGCQTSPEVAPAVELGLDRVKEYASLFEGKRVGIITNHTAYNSNGIHISEVFSNWPEVQISAFFGPEHGIYGKAEAGEILESDRDRTRNIPIYSLYGKTKKPTPEMLQNVDVLVYDIQSIGTRYYTYIYTMALAMEAAAEAGIPFVVLDRPNPINGVQVEGNLLEPEFASFVGLYPIPVRHGMTIGELAGLINREGWLAEGRSAHLTVMTLKNWRRDLWYDECGQSFIKPSPNIPDLTTAIIYPGACLIEGTNVSEGRGTTAPFRIIGAPWIDGVQLAAEMNRRNLVGVQFSDTVFTPVRIPGASENPKFRDRLCQGIKIDVLDRNTFQSYPTGIHLIDALQRLYPDSLEWRTRHFDRLCGTASVREAIQAKQPVTDLIASWQTMQAEFKSLRQKYLIY